MENLKEKIILDGADKPEVNIRNLFSNRVLP